MKIRLNSFRFCIAISLVSAVQHPLRAEPFAWGSNSYGETGDGTITPGEPPAGESLPRAVNVSGALAGKTVTAVAGGQFYSLALTSSGAVYSWGRNNYGQLGDPTSADRSSPGPVFMGGVMNGKNVKAIAAGVSHCMALATDGTLYGWGRNYSGELGDGLAGVDRNSPVAVTTSGALSGKTIAAVACGSGHTLALTTDGKVFAWGWNDYGQLGNGPGASSGFPSAVDMGGALSGKTVLAITAGYAHNLVLASDGKLYAWGDNYSGKLGDGTQAIQRTPVPVIMGGALAGKTIGAISAGGSHSLALTSDGQIFAWGSNQQGDLGDGTTIDRTVPTGVSMTGALNGKSVAIISAGGQFNLALATDGTLVSWGLNQNGQLGDGTILSSPPLGRPLPTAVITSGVLAGRTVTQIVACNAHTLILAEGPEIAVEDNAGAVLVAGNAAANFGAHLAASNTSRPFTIRNTGQVPLSGIGVTIDGLNAGEFSLTQAPPTIVAGGGSTAFTIRFAPATAGTKTAVLHIASSDADENPFDISLTGRGLAPEADDDGDGVTNAAEVLLAGSGFDPLADNAPLVTQLRASGLYRAADMQALALGAPLLERNAGKGNFLLRLGLEQSPDLINWTSLPGTVDFTITPAGQSPQYFRVLGRKP